MIVLLLMNCYIRIINCDLSGEILKEFLN